MRIVQNYRDLQRSRRLAINSRLSYKRVVNNGSPATQSASGIAYTPPPAPPVPANEMYTIAGDSLRTIAGSFITTIS
jgi:hypothetical protein